VAVPASAAPAGNDGAGSLPSARTAALENISGLYTTAASGALLNGTGACPVPGAKTSVLVINKWSGGAFSGWARPYRDSSLYGGPYRWGKRGQSEIDGIWFTWDGARFPISGDQGGTYNSLPGIQHITDPSGAGNPMHGYISGSGIGAGYQLTLADYPETCTEYVTATQWGPVPTQPSISGFAHKADGSPLVGAEVEIKAPRFDKTLTTAGDGSFGPIDVRAGYRYSVTATYNQNGEKVHLYPSKCLYGRLYNAACQSTLHSRDTLDAEFTLPEPSQLDVHVFASNVTGHSGLGIYSHFSATEAESKAFFTLPGSLNCVSGCWDVTVEVTDHSTGRPVPGATVSASVAPLAGQRSAVAAGSDYLCTVKVLNDCGGELRGQTTDGSGQVSYYYWSPAVDRKYSVKLNANADKGGKHGTGGTELAVKPYLIYAKTANLNRDETIELGGWAGGKGFLTKFGAVTRSRLSMPRRCWPRPRPRSRSLPPAR
jgi:hypothetical protein